MTIDGVLDFGLPTGSAGSNSLLLTGGDGNHYLIVGVTGFGSTIKIGQLEDKSVQTIDQTTWRADLQTLDGTLTAVTVGSTFTMSQAPIPVPGTAKFIVLGRGDAEPLAGYAYSVGVIYEIDAGGSPAVIGGFLRKTNNTPASYFGLANPSWCWGSIVVGSYVYAACWLGQWLFAGSTDTAYLLKLPVSGTTQDTAAGSWDAHVTLIPDAHVGGTIALWGSVVQQGKAAQKTASLLPRSDGTFDVINYVTGYSADNDPNGHIDIDTGGSEYWNIDPDTNTVNVTKQDARSWFGQPWDDEATTYAGDPSANLRDTYSAFDIQAITGGYELVAARLFSDEPTKIRFRRYVYTTATDTISYVDTFEKTIVNAALLAVKDVAMFHRLASNRVVFTIGDQGQNWYLGEAATPTTPDLDVPGVTLTYSAPMVVGLNYCSHGQLLRPDWGDDAGAAAGPAFGKTRRIHQYSMLFYRTRGVSVGIDFTNVRTIPLKTPGGTEIAAPTLYTGVISGTLETKYDFDNMIAWKVCRPYPATITAVGGYLSTQDK